MILTKHLINFNDKLYWIYRKVSVDSFKEEYIQDIRTYWDCDIVLKDRTENGQSYIFCREIPEAELAE